MRNYALGFGLLVALFACGGAAEPTTDPEPDAMPEESQPDSGTTVPTPDAAPTSISLRTLEPVDLKEVAGASATVAENLTVLTLSGTAATTASGLQVTINGEPVSMDSSGKWQKVVSFPPIDCNAEMTPNDLFIIEAKNSLGESVEQRIVVVRDPCPPRITWIPTEVQDESAWSVTFAGDAYVPCLRVPANPPTVVLDGVTPRTITKYLSNFYEEQAGNKTYFNASWVTGCQLLGSIPDEAGQNPFDLKWAIYDNIPGPVKLEVLLKAPGSSDFEPFLDETDQSEGGIVASKRTLRISEGNLEMVKKKQGATYTFRVRATDGRGNVTQLPDYPVTVNLLWGPAHFYALAVPATDPNSGPSNALDGGSLFRPSLGSASNRIAVRYHVIHNRTAETLYSGVRNISWTTPTGTARWARTTDRSYRVQDSCPALGAINWPAQEVDQPFETPRPLSFALVTGTPLNPSKSAFAVDKYSSAVMTLQQPGLSELPGSDIRTGYSPARQIFAQQESQVDTECTNIIEHTGDLCSNEADCVGNGGCDEAEGYCYVIRKRVTTIHRLWALVSLHMFSQGDVYREVSFDGTTWEPHGGADSLWHSLDRTHTEDWAPL